MANNINDAARGAADWLINLAKKEAKFNPMPYGLFKSSIDKQISWAQQVGVTLSFDAVAPLVRGQLNNAGIQVQQNNKRKGWGFKDYQEDILGQEEKQAQQDFTLTLSIPKGDDQKTAKLLHWLYEVFCKAEKIIPDSIHITAQFLGGNNGQDF